LKTSLYFHIPFCRQRCGYCDFVTFAGFDRLLPNYLEALKKQVTLMGRGEPVHTIYFGGGTPSLVPAVDYRAIFETIHSSFDVDPTAEISLEANPGTVGMEALAGYRNAGFNRISFGMQSAREDELRLLDRAHSPGEVSKAVENARSAGFDNINLDLIFGLPGQSLDDWKYSLKAALEMSPDHLSLYSLIVEEDTPLAKKIQNHILPELDEDIAAEQYEWSCSLLEEAGYNHYEISNWAKNSSKGDFRCQHNLQYWRLLPYFGFGCGAVGFLPAGWRNDQSSSMLMENESWIGKYIQQVNLAYKNRDKNIFLKAVGPAYEMETRLYVGFRLLDEGVKPIEFLDRFKVDIFQVFGPILQKLMDKSLIETLPDGTLRLTRNAWLVANRVFRKFINEE
jgi:oxygen-independent coproporphyrinogen III oxidase